MRHGDRLLKLSRKTKPRRHLLRNLVTSLVTHDRIVTTKAKARAMRGLADKMVSISKNPKINLDEKKKRLRQVLTKKEAVEKVISDLLPRFEQKNGNYTVTRHYGYRKGDGAKLSIVEYHSNNYYLYEEEQKKTLTIKKAPEFTIKVLREEASFFKQSIENIKNGSQEGQLKFFEKQLDRVQRELNLLDKSEVHLG
jgi:large subunit ribosomal protein L17